MSFAILFVSNTESILLLEYQKDKDSGENVDVEVQLDFVRSACGS